MAAPRDPDLLHLLPGTKLADALLPGAHSLLLLEDEEGDPDGEEDEEESQEAPGDDADMRSVGGEERGGAGDREGEITRGCVENLSLVTLNCAAPDHLPSVLHPPSITQHGLGAHALRVGLHLEVGLKCELQLKL